MITAKMLRNTIIRPSGARGALRPAVRTSRFPTPPRPSQRTITTTPPRSAPIPKTNRSTGFTFSSHSRITPLRNQTILQRLRSSIRYFHRARVPRNKPTSSRKSSSSAGPAEAEPQSLSARLKKLSREYGWSALGVYLTLSALDFPFCYLLVRWVGTDKIGEWEHIVVSNVEKAIPESVKQTWHDWRASMKKAEHDITGSDQVSDAVEMAGWGVEEAEEKNKKHASLATQLALAYAIHKSFIFVRVPLAAAVTPKVVRVLRGWGWDIGKRTTKEAKAINRASRTAPKIKRS